MLSLTGADFRQNCQNQGVTILALFKLAHVRIRPSSASAVTLRFMFFSPPKGRLFEDSEDPPSKAIFGGLESVLCPRALERTQSSPPAQSRIWIDSSSSKFALLHGASSNEMLVCSSSKDMLVRSSAIRNANASRFKERKAMAMRRAVQQPQRMVSTRDVVLATIVLLTACGFVHFAAVLWKQVHSADSVPETLRVLTSLSRLDMWMASASTVIAFVGFAMLAGTFSSLYADKATRLLNVCGIALFAITLTETVLLAVASATHEPENVWHSMAFMKREDLFEARVNDVYCRVKGAQICQFGSFVEASQVFPLQSWPVGSMSQPGKTIHSSCEGFDDTIRWWGYPAKMELCRLCKMLAKEEQRGGEELLRVADAIMLQELQWCGAYLVNKERTAIGRETADNEVDANASPYRKNRDEFQQLLMPSQPETMPKLGIRVLFVVITAAISSLFTLFSSLLLVKHSVAFPDNDKVQV